MMPTISPVFTNRLGTTPIEVLSDKICRDSVPAVEFLPAIATRRDSKARDPNYVVVSSCAAS